MSVEFVRKYILEKQPQFCSLGPKCHDDSDSMYRCTTCQAELNKISRRGKLTFRWLGPDWEGYVKVVGGKDDGY
jgi:hypothetical protein